MNIIMKLKNIYITSRAHCSFIAVINYIMVEEISDFWAMK